MHCKKKKKLVLEQDKNFTSPKSALYMYTQQQNIIAKNFRHKEGNAIITSAVENEQCNWKTGR